MTEELAHIGTPRKSGRYPWGSGDTPHQRHQKFLDYVEDYTKKGVSEADIRKQLGPPGQPMTTPEFRALKSVASNERKQADVTQAVRLSKAGLSNVAIGIEMDRNESSVRSLLRESNNAKINELEVATQLLRDRISPTSYLDVGRGIENQIGISSTRLQTAVSVLRDEGYEYHYLNVPGMGTGKETKYKILAPPGTPWLELNNNQDRIRTISAYSEDKGRTFLGIEPPVSVKLKRVGVRYAEEGGATKDGVIELRRGVKDLSLGKSRYAQVRIEVDDTHFLKGMAMYSDNMPDGVDMLFNTNKSDTGNKLDAMKPIKDDKDNPFGSVVRQKHYLDGKGVSKLSPLNIVGAERPDGTSVAGEEGGWYNWSRSLSSQMMSKQPTALVKQQLDLAYDIKKAEFDEINALNNPAVKKKLLQSFSDDADSSAVHLKAAGLPRTRNHVILPINSLKDTEIYAPNYKQGEQVVLIRHPHGGIFEIPELTVNNRNREAISVIDRAKDAVGINARVAERLSGADFDGDTVLVIPNPSSGRSRVSTKPPLEELKDFNPRNTYKGYPGMKEMRSTQQEMGNITNLINDMSIKKAPFTEIARAVKHSMVVIDAEKHGLNYKQSAQDNGISALKAKYQGRSESGALKGAATLVSRSKSDIRINDRKPRSAANGGPIDPATGKKMYEPTGETYVSRKPRSKKNGGPTDPVTGQKMYEPGSEKTVFRKTSSQKMAEVDDAFKLSSGTPMEAVYATHANKMKALGNVARKEWYFTPNVEYSTSAKIAYQAQVDTLTAKLNIAKKNAPQERQAQLFAAATMKAKKQAKPDMDRDEEKKLKGQALKEARLRMGAKKENIQITPIEWTAIQSGAISNSRLNDILDNTDLDVVKALATPRVATVMVPAKLARAKNMLANGHTPSEIAEQLGVSVSTLNSSLST